MSFPLSWLRKGIFAIILFLSFLSYLFLSFLKLFPASLGVHLGSSFYPPETIRWTQKIQMLALYHGVHSFLTGTCAKYWLPTKPSRSLKTSPSSCFLPLPVSVLIPPLHASWWCDFPPFFCLSFYNLTTLADINAINCYLPVQMLAGQYFYSEK